MRRHSLLVALPFSLGACAIAVSALGAPPAHAQDGLVATDKSGDDEEAEQIIDDSVPPPEQAQLGFFIGTWRCTGTSSTEMGVDVPTTLTFKIAQDAGGRWLTVRSELTPKARGARPVVSIEAWGASHVDGAISLIRQGVTSQGGVIQSTSSGFVGDRFDWGGTTHVHAKAGKEKLGFERTGPKAMKVLTAAGAPELRVVFEGECKR